VNLALHTHEKALPDEAGSVRHLDMTYTHIPVDFQNPTEQDFEQFCAVMEQFKDAPIHVRIIECRHSSTFGHIWWASELGAVPVGRFERPLYHQTTGHSSYCTAMTLPIPADRFTMVRRLELT
jgi:hypothetical protein